MTEHGAAKNIVSFLKQSEGKKMLVSKEIDLLRGALLSS